LSYFFEAQKNVGIIKGENEDSNYGLSGLIGSHLAKYCFSKDAIVLWLCRIIEYIF